MVVGDPYHMDEETTYAALYRETIPSVVSVYLTADADDPRSSGGAGSGFVFDERGFVVTNAHVVRDADAVDVRFSGGEWRTATVDGVDPYTDLAVLYVDDLPVEAVPLPVARENPVPGTAVAAFGNPMGLDGTMTRGIVSGTSRSSPSGNGFAIPDSIQTDAAINPGNSGGPLVDLDGRVVGVNRARSGDNIGFAISAPILRRVAPSLVEYGEVGHSYARIRTLDVSPTVAAGNDLDEPGGVLVVDVGDGPAAGVLVPASGTRTVRGREVPVGGDVVVGIDGRPVNSHEELTRYLVTETEPGQVVSVEVLRDGERVTERFALDERPAPGERSRWRGRRRRGASG